MTFTIINPVQMTRPSRRVRRNEVRSSSRSPTPERQTRRRRMSSSPPPTNSRRAAPATPATTQADRTAPTASSTLSAEDLREAVAAEVARSRNELQGGAAVSTVAGGNARGATRGRGRGWGRGRWVNFGFFLPHAGPYTPICRAHREPGCHVCMFFSPNMNYMDPGENGFAIEY